MLLYGIAETDLYSVADLEVEGTQIPPTRRHEQKHVKMFAVGNHAWSTFFHLMYANCEQD
jgi:hypothetical protein